MSESPEVRAKIQQVTGPHEDLLTIVKRRKLQWYGHVSRSSGLAKTILQGIIIITIIQDMVKGRRTQRKWKNRWEDNIKEWTNLEFVKSQRPGVRQVPEGRGAQIKMEETGCEIICGAPTTLGVKA